MLADSPPWRNPPTPHKRTCRSRLNKRVGAYPNELTSKDNSKLPPAPEFTPGQNVLVCKSHQSTDRPNPKRIQPWRGPSSSKLLSVVYRIRLPDDTKPTSVWTFDPHKILQTPSIDSGTGLSQTREVIPRKDFAYSCFGRIRNGRASYRHSSSC